jgi:PTH1 family peptidyl-tRNA hydrolase
MKLIVGLGNPGRKYQGTRHNVGFDVLNELSRRHGSGGRKTKFQGELQDAELEGQRAILLWPQTYMNLSGTSVGQTRSFYGVAEHDLLVVCDDFNLPLAKLRFRSGGTSGGNNGLADVIRVVGTEFSRLRVGVGPLPERFNAADFVLSRFGKHEGAEIEVAIALAADAVVLWAQQGVEHCMNKYN